MREELACKIRVDGGPHIFENMYTHHGASGHETIFAYEISILGNAVPAHEPFTMEEDDGSTHLVEWVELDRFLTGRETLYPRAWQKGF
ncbi:MAG: hypothetical protein JOZ88_03800 [Hyphomicrobiales bacterium]|nr:hypothetical protein [Hyphomicrobiales bacterium]